MVSSKIKFTQNWMVLIILKLLIRVYNFVNKNPNEMYQSAYDNKYIFFMKIYLW